MDVTASLGTALYHYNPIPSPHASSRAVVRQHGFASKHCTDGYWISQGGPFAQLHLLPETPCACIQTALRLALAVRQSELVLCLFGSVSSYLHRRCLQAAVVDVLTAHGHAMGVAAAM